MTIFLASVGFGLVTASVLAVAAVGFTLQFGVTDVLNLAYGAVMIALARTSPTWSTRPGLNIWVGLVVAVVACSAGSAPLNSGTYTPFQRRGATADHVGDRLPWHDADHRVRHPGDRGRDQRVLHHGPGAVGPRGRASAYRGAARRHRAERAGHDRHACPAALHQARQGDADRGQQDAGPQLRDQDVPGDQPDLADTGALCGWRGDLCDGAGSFDATNTNLFLILILAAIFLGGPGQAYGATLGAVVIGLATEISAAYITPSYKYVVGFVALLLILGVRPTGLLGARA